MIPFEEVFQEQLEKTLVAIDGEVFRLLVKNH